MPEPENRPIDNVGQAQNPGQFDAAREMAERKANRVIDQFANKIPGGQKFSGQAKQAVSGILHTLEKEAGNRLGNLGGVVGGLFGKSKSEPGQPPVQTPRSEEKQ